MADNGEEKLIAVARHIAKTLGHSASTTDDILNIFSNFDGRLRDKLIGNHSADAIERTVNSLEQKLFPHISADASICSNSLNTSSFLDSIDQLIAAIREWNRFADDEAISVSLGRADGLLQQAMLRLEDELRNLVQRDTELDSSSSDDDEDVSFEFNDALTDYNGVDGGLSAATVADLNDIVKRMVAAGYEKECSHVYSACRQEFLEERLSRLGLCKFSIDEIQRMEWSKLEDEIEKWIKTINVALRNLIPSDRRLCNRVFSGFLSTADLSFSEICRASILQLLSFADAVVIGGRSPERLFKVLDVYETVRDLMPEFELIFSDDYCFSLIDEAITILQRLREVIKGIFIELENSISRDPPKSVVPGGGLHPISRYVMNYLQAACRSRKTLEQVFDESDNVVNNLDYRKGEKDLCSSSSFAVQLASIMDVLENNLEAKSKFYRDPALCSVFMMNNGRYIVKKVKDNELGSLLGDDWIRKQTVSVRQYHASYKRSSWSKILGVLKVDNPTSSVSSSAVSKSLREKLKLFNSYFEEICKTQSSWVIYDDLLREELRISVSGMLSPAYRNFIGRVYGAVDLGKHVDRHLRYSVEDVEARITELFEGTSSGRR